MENLHIVIGNLGADPEIKYMSDGTAKATFSVATTQNWTDKQSGESKESVEWHTVEAWGRTGEACSKHLKKGRQVYVQGSHHTENWEKDGAKHMRHYIRAQKVKFLKAAKG